MTYSAQPGIAAIRSAILAGMALVLAIIISTSQGSAQTYQLLHSFTGGRDGAAPLDGLTIDRAGNLYGTASAGGNQVYGCNNGSWGNTGCGSVFELAHSGTGWILRPLYDFQGPNSGNPGNGVTFGPDGALYGVTNGVGGCNSFYTCGTVFRLAPPPTPCAGFTCNWQETVLHSFSGTPDGSLPGSRLIADSVGNLFGVTFFGGGDNVGAAFQMSRNGGNWTENVIYSFTENSQGYGVYFPSGQLAIDPSNNIYGPADCSIELSCFYGSVWQLQSQQGSWTLNELYHFNGNNGYQPVALLRDSSGDFFGTTFGDGGHDSAAVYELTPSNGGYNYTQLYNYGGVGDASTAALVMDAAGNLYGADSEFGFGYIFKLTRSGNNWTFSTLHSFSGPDGEGATGTLVFDSAGNLYGTNVRGGAYGYGVIWEITP